MLDEGPQQSLSALHGTRVASSLDSQFMHIVQGLVRQRVHFEVAPEIFNGIELRSIRGQEDGTDMTMIGQEVCDTPRAMCLQTIPDQDHRSADLAIQLGEEFYGTQGVDIGIAAQAKVQVNPVTLRRHAQSTDSGHLLVRAGTLMDHRGVAPGRPATADQRRHHHARFVDKGQPGFCGLQPIVRNNRPI